jgi:NADH-quinone oxidoreductase subunit K
MNNILNEIGIENYIPIKYFCIGVLYRRNAIIVFMSIEIMLNALILFCFFQPIIRMHKVKFLYFFYGCCRCRSSWD